MAQSSRLRLSFQIIFIMKQCVPDACVLKPFLGLSLSVDTQLMPLSSSRWANAKHK